MLEPILKGLIEWLYGLMIDIMSYASGELIGVMSMDLSYFERTAPVISDIVNIFIALGWALLIGNLVFQSLKAMMSGAGFEAEDPKMLFLRTFVFAFLLLASRQICSLCSTMTGTVISLLDLPSSIAVTTPDESMFSLGSGAKWLLVIIVGVVLMVQMVKLLFEIGERYVITSVLTFFAPLAFAMGGSRNTNDIFKGWCRMYGSMLVMMIMNIVFLKLIMSAMASMASGGVLVWLVFVVALTRVARKIDSHIGKIGLNPAQTGNGVGSRMPGAMTMMAVRVMTSTISRSMAGAKGSTGRNGSSGRSSTGGSGPKYGGGAGSANRSYNTSYGGGTNSTSYGGSSSTNTGVHTNSSNGGNTNINSGSVNNSSRQNTGGAGMNTPKAGTINMPRAGGANAPKPTQMNAQRSAGAPAAGTSPVSGTQNISQNNAGQSNPQRPSDMSRPKGGSQINMHSSGGTAYSSEHSAASGYSLNTGRYTASGKNNENIKRFMQNPNAARPVVPRASAGANPAGKAVMNSVVNASGSNSVNMGDTHSRADKSGTVNSHATPTPAPSVKPGTNNTTVNGSVRNNGGRSFASSVNGQRSVNANGSSETHTSVSGGSSTSKVRSGTSVGGNRSYMQSGGNTNVTENNSNSSRSSTEYGGNVTGVNVAGNTSMHSERSDSTRVLEKGSSRSEQNSRFVQQQSSTETTEHRINHEYRHGKYNPAAANRKVKKSYYRKDNEFTQRPSERSRDERRRGADRDGKHKR